MLLSTQQVADKLNVNSATIVKWCRHGVLPAVNVGTKTRAFWKVDDAALKEWRRNQSAVPASNAHAVPPAPKPAPEKPAPPAGMAPMQDVAKSVGVHYTTASDWWKAGKVKGERVGNRVFLDPDSVRAYSASRHKAVLAKMPNLPRLAALAAPEAVAVHTGEAKTVMAVGAMWIRLDSIEGKVDRVLQYLQRMDAGMTALREAWGVPEKGQ